MPNDNRSFIQSLFVHIKTILFDLYHEYYNTEACFNAIVDLSIHINDRSIMRNIWKAYEYYLDPMNVRRKIYYDNIRNSILVDKNGSYELFLL